MILTVDGVISENIFASISCQTQACLKRGTEATKSLFIGFYQF